MTNTKDQMQGIFAVNFDFKKGEQPTAAKFSGWIKQTNSAFSDITQVLGDPWEYQDHTNGTLSPERLAQTNLARMIGPSDWISPHGASWGESSTATVTLEAGRNSWSLGYPLVKVNTSLTPQSDAGSVTNLTWDDIDIENSPTGLFTTEESNPSNVNSDGKFHIDYEAGIITTYKISTSEAELKINNLCMFGPGVPWGTANVIPTWKQTADLCSLTENDGSPSGGESFYTLRLPNVTRGTRTSDSNISGASGVTYSQSAAGAGTNTASYKLPYSITSNYTNGDQIPEGFILLWDEDSGRIIPTANVNFFYGSANPTIDDQYSLTISTTENYLTVSSSYRIFVAGTSLSEAVNYLMNTTRSNTHSGLGAGQDGRTLAYHNPISHKDLSERFGGLISSPDSSISDDAFKFKQSKYPTNDHPQYLHRAGWMQSEADGNSGNAMRGDIVFARENTFELSTSDGGLESSTYGLRFGGGGSDVPEIRYSGGIESDKPMPFGLTGVGLYTESSTVDSKNYGALTIESNSNQPLYLRSYNSEDNSGPSISFDYKREGEMNYIKLVDLNSTSSFVANMPANTNDSFSEVLPITPILSGRISNKQLREFRFRGVPYVESATNTGLTNSGDYDNYFTSPGIVGADFFNCYSNAIFFSEQGDGIRTSLTENQSWFINNTSDRPIGLYYEPESDNGKGKYLFYVGDNIGSTFNVASFGYREGIIKPKENNASLSVDITGNWSSTYYRSILEVDENYLKIQKKVEKTDISNYEYEIIGKADDYIQFKTIDTRYFEIDNDEGTITLKNNDACITTEKSGTDSNYINLSVSGLGDFGEESSSLSLFKGTVDGLLLDSFNVSTGYASINARNAIILNAGNPNNEPTANNGDISIVAESELFLFADNFVSIDGGEILYLQSNDSIQINSGIAENKNSANSNCLYKKEIDNHVYLCIKN